MVTKKLITTVTKHIQCSYDNNNVNIQYYEVLGGKDSM